MEEREKSVFVLGFCFSSDSRVVLIRKKKGDWQEGMLNGIGGRVEPGEEIVEAMAREFREETGKYTPESCWQYIFTMSTDRFLKITVTFVTTGVFRKYEVTLKNCLVDAKMPRMYLLSPFSSSIKPRGMGIIASLIVDSIRQRLYFVSVSQSFSF